MIITYFVPECLVKGLEMWIVCKLLAISCYKCHGLRTNEMKQKHRC